MPVCLPSDASLIRSLSSRLCAAEILLNITPVIMSSYKRQKGILEAAAARVTQEVKAGQTVTGAPSYLR